MVTPDNVGGTRAGEGRSSAASVIKATHAEMVRDQVSKDPPVPPDMKPKKAKDAEEFQEWRGLTFRKKTHKEVNASHALEHIRDYGKKTVATRTRTSGNREGHHAGGSVRDDQRHASRHLRLAGERRREDGLVRAGLGGRCPSPRSPDRGGRRVSSAEARQRSF